MSSKTRIIAFAIAFAFMAGFAFSAQADVTGSFTTNIAFEPQTTATEMEPLDFDIQNAINLTVVISGLSTTLHSHFGIAGVEDVALNYAATLGALDISGEFVFSRFAGFCFATNALIGGRGESCLFNLKNTTPLTDELLFVKKRVKTSISLGGVSFENLALFEDTAYPETLAPTSHSEQSQEFAFGDVITLSGQTPSGVSITASTGICASLSPNVIKKHSWPYEVNPACAQQTVETDEEVPEVKPNLAFDFETLNISGIPVADGVTANADIVCVQTTQCSMLHTFNFSGVGPVPFSATFAFDDLFTLSFAGATLEFSTGAGTLITQFDSTGQLGAVEVDLSTTLNPDTNPANFTINAALVPGQGIDFADVGIAVSRSNVDFSMNANFGVADGAGSTSVDFQGVEFSVGSTVGAFDVSTSAEFGAFGFQSWESSFTINF